MFYVPTPVDRVGGHESCEEICTKHAPESLPWQLAQPRPALVELIQSRKVFPKGKALDLCCGLGTNTIYLASAGFQTTGIDISKTTVTHAQARDRAAGVNIPF